jgi:hypothetical protein
MKKVNKKSLPLRENSLPLHTLFCGQTASSMRPYGRSGQIICIGFEILKQQHKLHCPNPKILWQTGKVNQGLESQPPPPYLPNGDSVEEFFYIIGFRTLENGGVGHLQIYKKKSQSGQNAHQTQKPQISYILQTWHF